MRVCVSVSVSVFESVCVRVFYCIRLCVGWFSALLCLCACFCVCRGCCCCSLMKHLKGFMYIVLCVYALSFVCVSVCECACVCVCVWFQF